MRILFCCQFYAPSVGGVQEVMRQLAERLVVRGHQVTVATARLLARNFNSLNGVDIKEFEVYGNLASGMAGELKEFQDFVVGGNFDVIMIYAAQQWTFDALWPELDKIVCIKVLVPCGFSGLYEPGYARYFQKLPEVLRKFDHLVFHASKYRDVNFARKCGIEKISVIPNGASEIEFEVAVSCEFRSKYGIPEESFVFLTVGSFTGLKGHLELAKAFSLMRIPDGRHATLILNGNEIQRSESGVEGNLRKLAGLIRTIGVKNTLVQIVKTFSRSTYSPQSIAQSINSLRINKIVLVTDLPREELTQAYLTADLFVFASNIEYSPLVLFEAAAAGTPFLSVNVGNAAEIAEWTGAGVMCSSEIDNKGYTHVDKMELAKSMTTLMEQKELLENLGAAGRRNWRERFTWEKVADQYEHLFYQLLREKLIKDELLQ